MKKYWHFLGIATVLVVITAAIIGVGAVSAQTVCSPATVVSVPFSKDGAGTFCYQATSLCGYINSWNLTTLSINGANYTNIWVAGSSIAPLNGVYTITYSSSVAWGHFEIAGTPCGAPSPTNTSALTSTRTNTPGGPTATRTATPPAVTATRTNTPSVNTPTRTNTPGTVFTPTRTPTQGSGGANTMGFIGCSMAENTAQGYSAVGGTRMWGPYGTGSLVVQSWTDTNSSAWQKFDQQVTSFGRPTAVWVQICIFAQNGATYNEVKQLIANARQHAAPGATIYITGQPLYESGHTCTLAGAGGPELTDSLARQAAADATQNVIYPGAFHLLNNELSDACHANTAGQQSLGQQALAFWN